VQKRRNEIAITHLVTAAENHLSSLHQTATFFTFALPSARHTDARQLTLKLDTSALSSTAVTMLARRACARALNGLPTSQVLGPHSRSFTAATATQGPRAPSLADITPDSAASFNKKQQEFRDGLVAAQKQREQQDSAYLSRPVHVDADLANAHCRRSP
jgi:hypothetical protein